MLCSMFYKKDRYIESVVAKVMMILSKKIYDLFSGNMEHRNSRFINK